jgi:fibronectin-binding autotransporter adhesin
MANFNPLGYTGKVTGNTARLGVVQFDPVDFSVSESGVVSLGGSGALQTLSGNTGGNRPPTTGNIAVVGSGSISVAGSGSTLTISLLPGTSLIATLTGDSGGARSPTTGNMNILGTANQVTTTGSGSTLTLSLPSALTAPGSVTATTSITATAGDITATLGHVIINGAAKQLRIHGGAVTDFIGQATLANGTVTVSNTNIAATDKILVTRHGVNGSTALGVFNVAISAATSFTISALKPADATTETGDASIVDYVIVRQV